MTTSQLLISEEPLGAGGRVIRRVQRSGAPLTPVLLVTYFMSCMAGGTPQPLPRAVRVHTYCTSRHPGVGLIKKKRLSTSGTDDQLYRTVFDHVMINIR